MRKLLLFILAISLSAFSFGQQTQTFPAGKMDSGISGIDNSQSMMAPVQPLNIYSPSSMSTWVLPSTNSTSGNSRIPRNAAATYQREEFLILPSEMTASGFPSGYNIDAIGFLIYLAGIGTQTGQMNIYLRNTTDVTYTLGTTWTTSGFTQVSSDPAFTVPIAVGSYSIPFVNGTPFTYTGSGVYVAWEFSNPSGISGSTSLTAYCNTNQASLCYGYQGTVLGSNLSLTAFRPATYFTNNALTDIIQVTNIYATERVPTPLGTPSTVGVRVANVSASAATFNLTLTIKDVLTQTVRFTSTLPVTALAGGASTTVNFGGWTPTLLEDVTINAVTSAIAGETYVSNNTLTITGNVNNNLFSYNYSLANPSGYGFTYPGTGIFAAKYTMQGTGLVKGANVMIYNYAANVGNTVYAVIMNAAGTILSQSPNYTLLAGDMGTNVTFTFPTAQTISNADFYVGIAQTAGTVQWFPLGTFTENPGRGNTFYNFAITGGTPSVSVAALKYGIEAVLTPPPTVVTNAATVITNNSATLNGTVNANGNSSTITYQYGLTTAYGSTVAGVPSPVGGTTITATSAAITGLIINTVYHFREVAVNIGGTSYGNDMIFSTVGPLPSVVTTAASAVTTTSATLNGTVNANGNNSTVNFEYGLTTSYGTTLPGVPPTVSGSSVTPVLAAITGLLPGNTYHFRVDGINTNGTSFGNDMTFNTPAIAPTLTTLAATAINTTIATLNGLVNANGASTAIWFDYGLTSAYGTIVAGTPSSVTGNTATTVSANLTGLSNGTTYHYRVRGNNAIGTTNGNDVTFVTGCFISDPAGPVTGPTQVCQGGGGYVYSVSPIANASGYVWTVPIGGTIISGLNTNTITVSYSPTAVSGYVFVYGTAACGNGAPAQLLVTMNSPAAPTLAGPASVCVNIPGNVYTTQAGMGNYVWNVSAGGVITAGGTTSSNTITVTWTYTGTGIVSVNYNNAAGCPSLSPAVYNVTVHALPAPSINGPNPACTIIPSYYTTQAGMTSYTWSISSGGLITAGAGTNAITVTWNTTGAQSVSVDYSNANGCTAAAPVSYPVTVNQTTVPTITGPNDVCVNSGYHTYTTQTGMTAYNWAISSGGTISYGAGTSSIMVSWTQTGAQWVSVNFINPSGCSPMTPTQYNVTVMAMPGAAGSITGTSSLCAGTQGVAYSVGTITNATTYVWSLPAGATIATGANTNAITVNFAANATSGPITVYGNSICGNGGVSPNFNVTVNAIPPAPVVTNTSTTLNSSASAGNHWYFEGTLISGATGQTYVATQDGHYWDVVTLIGCSSDTSNHVLIVTTGINSHSSATINLYPVPNDGRFNVSITTSSDETFSIKVYDNLGVNIYEETKVNVNGSLTKVIDLRPIPAGVYTVIFENNQNRVIKKVVVSK